MAKKTTTLTFGPFYEEVEIFCEDLWPRRTRFDIGDVRNLIRIGMAAVKNDESKMKEIIRVFLAQRGVY